jgi:RNA polymerase sigma-70 factor (ECF subfamily)
VLAEAKRMGAERDPVAALISAGAYDEAATSCVRLHTHAIGRLCIAMLGSQAEAEEATQETFLNAHRAMAQFRAEGSVRGWLMAIARRVCVRRLSMRARQARHLALVVDAEHAPASPDELAERRRRAHAVRRALEQLKPSEREILLLRYHSGLSFREVVEVCGLEPATARKRTSRALARLRTLLKHEVD